MRRSNHYEYFSVQSCFPISGVGQAEFAVADMVDMLVLLLPPAGGDELQVSMLTFVYTQGIHL